VALLLLLLELCEQCGLLTNHTTFPSAVLIMMEKVREQFASKSFDKMVLKYYRAAILAEYQ